MAKHFKVPTNQAEVEVDIPDEARSDAWAAKEQAGTSAWATDEPTATGAWPALDELPSMPQAPAPAPSGNEEVYRHRHEVGHRHRGRTVAIVVAAVLAVVLVAGGACAFALYSSAMTAREKINGVIDTASALTGDDLAASLAGLGSSIDAIQADASAAYDEVSSPLWNAAALLPVVGGDIASVQTAAGVLNDFAQTTLPDLGDAANTIATADFSDGEGGLNLEPIISVSSTLSAANEQLQRQSQELAAIPDSNIEQIGSALTKGKEKFAQLSDAVDELSGVVGMLPSFLGADGQRTYLLLAQTNSEIRSSGGLVGSTGYFTADHGAINFGDFHSDSEFTQGNVADLVGQNQDVLFEGRGFGYYEINITCSPDFSQVAQMAASYWNQQDFGAGMNIDGVMSLDPAALGALLDVTGPVTLSDGRVLDSSNCADFLLNGVYNAMATEETDQYFIETAEQVIEQTFSSMSSDKLMGLAKTLLSLSEGRHVYLWSFHEEDLASLRAVGLTHEITDDAANPVCGFYLNNTVGTKMDYYMQRATTVERTAEDEAGAHYHVAVTMTNTVTPEEVASISNYITADSADGTIYNQVNVFAPAGGSVSGLTCSLGTEFAEVEGYGRMCYHGNIAVAPGQTITIKWDVTTAAGAEPLVLDQTPTIALAGTLSYNY